MGILTHAFTQSATPIATTLNAHGDQVFDAFYDPIPCRFRYITQINQGNNAESLDAPDAIAWFEPTAPIVEGSIFMVEDHKWRVSRLVRARKLRGTGIQFLKAYVNKHQIVIPT